MTETIETTNTKTKTRIRFRRGTEEERQSRPRQGKTPEGWRFLPPFGLGPHIFWLIAGEGGSLVCLFCHLSLLSVLQIPYKLGGNAETCYGCLRAKINIKHLSFEKARDNKDIDKEDKVAPGRQWRRSSRHKLLENLPKPPRHPPRLPPRPIPTCWYWW